MTNVNCNVKMCGYNEDSKCAKKRIDIEGLFAKSKIGTFCQSFKNPHNSDILVSEMAKEMSPEASPVKVKCSANYCIHNENSECIAKEITVGNENANYRSETECDSFKAR
ncbi:MAG: DUF1540 domain-containing protein [Anaeroplasmataceae bacterium]|jgi:Domain of Unknown Function (DUF1540).|nr:DUF1540 domain-containing protein [Anaeroplasmataceae bacterium]